MSKKIKKQKFTGPVVSTPILRKVFDYTQGNVKLNFTLRTDIPDEVVPFLELLKVAVVDVQASIDALNVKTKKKNG